MRVLLVEDDHRLSQSLARGLEDAGFSVDAVYDGDEGLAAALAMPYDALILDIMLPGLDGLQVSRQLRARRVHTPILMLTARDAVDDRVGGLEAGADDYLSKPFALRELVARIRALARRHLPDRAAILSAGPIVIDTGARELRVRGKPISLTAKEFAILEYFLLHPRQVLSQTQILEHAWHYDFEGGRNLVEVYVGRIRRKLTAAGSPDPLLTLRGAGYRFEPPKCDDT